jgi:hypothetical protein
MNVHDKVLLPMFILGPNTTIVSNESGIPVTILQRIDPSTQLPSNNILVKVIMCHVDQHMIPNFDCIFMTQEL